VFCGIPSVAISTLTHPNQSAGRKNENIHIGFAAAAPPFKGFETYPFLVCVFCDQVFLNDSQVPGE